ncbi:MAG: transcription-repair coupling factor [Archangiaceae bacterium]|nr:transcription-repair coupling factor [Archangiaceae bacterium]
MLSRLGAPLVCITQEEDEADRLANDLRLFLGEAAVLQLPSDEALPWDELIKDTGLVTERLSTLFHLRHQSAAKALVLSVRGACRKVLPPQVMGELSETLTPASELGRDALARKLTDMGYRNSPLVEDVGAFSLRGDIIDVWAPLEPLPVRIELFGDDVESMRSFDPQTQRTLEDVKVLRLLPARELFFNTQTRAAAEASVRDAAEQSDVPTSRVRERIEQIREGISSAGLESLWPGFFSPGLSTVFDYLPFWSKKTPIVWVDEPVAQERTLIELGSELKRSHAGAVERGDLTLPVAAHFLGASELREQLAKLPRIEGGGLSLDSGGAAPITFPFQETRDLREAIRSHHGEEGALTPLIERLSRWRDERITAAVACGSRGQIDRLKRLLSDRGVAARVHEGPLGADPAALYDVKLPAHLFLGDASAGFVDSGTGLAVLADEEIFGVRAHRKTRRKSGDGGFAANFSDLKEGDLVVHAEFGVARYAGLTSMQVQGVKAELLILQFAGKDKVYLPVSRMRLVSRFTGGDPEKVQLDKLGSDSWARTKARVKENLLKMAAELLTLYAQRKAHGGHAFSAPDRYFRQFEADFEFDETPDQQKAIDDVVADMQKPEPMDRLVCGDVGYGKTEVAMRAAFKAVLDRKQVAVLVPTTLLAHQHHTTFKKRFDGYPVTIEVVSGLQKPPEAREVLRRAREGRLDILIGTHKLLGGEVGFRDLGLLIIDEEQRFGVKQKESLKKLKAQVDTLTLSATPIPRTLNMAMSGLRDMSIIATPPADRRAIRTFVNRFDPEQIKEAVTRELHRGGQVFFVHDRIASLPNIEQQLHQLLPNVTIGVAHGQMHDGQLEKVMLDFVQKRLQVLLCTSIIESGLDISSANTLIVDRADHFGLAQLYQLRGRVGRSKERAYAYLLVPAERGITKDAERRLEVLQAFTELGAGFSIASHDLEIRGAGNLLGGEQSGSIESVGFDLYAQMLEEAVAEMRGEPPRTQVEPDVNLPIEALLPEEYVPDVQQRLVLYKRFSSAQTPEELDDLRAELIDRFGDAPDEVDNLGQLMLLKMDLRRLRLRSLDAGPGRLVVTLGADAALDPSRLAGLVQKSKGALRLTPEMKLVAKTANPLEGDALMAAAKELLVSLLKCSLQR